MSGKKIVLKLDINDDEAKKKALKAVSGVQGIDSVSMDMKEKKMTVIGEVDPVEVVTKLKGKKKKNKWYIEIVTVGPAKEPEKKKEEPKKDETAKKEEPKKDDKKKDDNERFAEMVKAYNPWLNYYYHVHSVEENPNACVIV